MTITAISLSIRAVVASALFTASTQSLGASLAAAPLYDGMLSGSAAQILHIIRALADLALIPIVLIRGVK